MKKHYFFTFLLLFISLFSNAQDIITKISGDEIKAKVTDIELETVKYKMFDNLNGPSYTILKSDVFMIKYENGTKDVFGSNKNTDNPKIEPQQNPKVETSKIEDEKILLTRHGYFYKGLKINDAGIQNVLSKNASPEIQKQFKSGQTIYGVGYLIVTTGLLAGLSGCLIIGIYDSYDYNYTPTSGIVLAASGLGLMFVGFPFTIAGRAIVKKSVVSYNNSLSTSYNFSLNMGITQKGIGFVLKF